MKQNFNNSINEKFSINAFDAMVMMMMMVVKAIVFKHAFG